MTAPIFANRTIWTGDNLQLICGACNSAKGAGSQEELKAKLKQQGIIE